MTTTNRKAEHDMTALYRVLVKSNGIVIWTIASSSGIDYHTTIFEGRVTSCERVDGEPCKAWRYRRSCHHATLALQREAARKEAMRGSEPQEQEPRAESEPRRTYAPLNGNKGFSLLR